MPSADDAANKKRADLIEDLRNCWWSSFCTRVIALLQVFEVAQRDIALQFQQYARRLAEENDRQIDGADLEKPQLNQMDFQAQINSLRESVSKALQLFLKDPDASLVDSLNLPCFETTVPQEAQTIDLSTDVATTFNTFFGEERVGTWEPHLAQEYLDFFYSILNDLIYVVESRKPVDVTVSVVDSERLRRTVRSLQRLLGTTFNRADANEFGHLLQEVISDSERLFRHQLEHKAKTPDFAEFLSISLDNIDRKISRSVNKGASLKAVRLTQANWDLLKALEAAGKHGTTGKQLAEKLNTTESELSTRKAELKNAIASLGLTIPDDEFRLEMAAAHGSRLVEAFDVDTVDFSTFDLEMEEGLKNLDLSFPVPDLSDSDDAETAAAWVKSPTLMLETITFRLNEILAICEARSFPATVIQLQPKYIYTEEENSGARVTWRMPFLTTVCFTLFNCAKAVEIVNQIQPTPFKEEILIELGKCLHRGDTPEFDLAIKSCKEGLRTLAIWIKTKTIHDGTELNEPFVAPPSIWSIITQFILGNQERLKAKHVSPKDDESTTTTVIPRPPKATDINTHLVSAEEVALKLKVKNITIAVKTLKNSRTREWGNPDGVEGNAHLYNWTRIRPIVEKQFNVRFDD